ncbi:MAG: TPM domain-containing protein [Lachnospiraceae bacterium]|nr:TPM domain-containing protein [Lachnospiraceae bacterium]
MLKNKIIKKLSLAVAMSLSLVVMLSNMAFSYESEDCWGAENEESGYWVVVDDEADLLIDSEEEELYEIMMPISSYGNVSFVTISENYYSDTASFGRSYTEENFGRYASSVIFTIDMDNRRIEITSRGDCENKITTSIENIITDNIYTYASKGDYFTTAKRAFEQIYDVLEGNRIAQPMKYIGNAGLSILLGLLITYFIARAVSSTAKASNKEILDSMFVQFQFNNPEAHFDHETREYSPKSSGSGGGFSGGGGGGGHSGGSSGGHGF